MSKIKSRHTQSLKKNILDEKFMRNNEETKLLEEFMKFDPKYFGSK